MLVPTLLAALVSAGPIQPPASQPAAEPPANGRGRDPWVFRCIFEDRSRMVILAPAPDIWIAFNPNTCAVQKVWKGGMRFRGKVWDFSQDNCAAAEDAVVLAGAPSSISVHPDAPPDERPREGRSPFEPQPWARVRVKFDPERMWVFESDGASLTSGTLNLQDWSRVYIAFDETSRAGPFRIEVSADDGQTWTAQHFASTMHGSSDSDWQWNFKQLIVHAPQARVRVVQPIGTFNKRLRNLRIFGDSPAWSLIRGGETSAIMSVWRGYTLGDHGGSVTLEYDLLLPDKNTAQVRHSLNCSRIGNELRWTERYSITGIPADSRLSCAGLWQHVGISGPAATYFELHAPNVPRIIFNADGDSTITATIPAGAAAP